MTYGPITSAELEPFVRPGVLTSPQAIARMVGRPVAEVEGLIAWAALRAKRREPPAIALAGLGSEPGHVGRIPREKWKITAEAVAKKHGVTLADLVGKSRRVAVSRARQEAYAAVRDALGYSLPRIGRLFGGRDHTTVLFGIRAHAERKGGAR